METLEELFKKACSTESDINQHVSTLKEYSSFPFSGCRSVAEFGVRGGISTIGLLSGLKVGYDYESMEQTMYINKFYIPNLDLSQRKNNLHPPYFYIGVDIQDCPNSETMKQLANKNGIEYTFIKEDSAKVNIPEVDLLFIDSWHIYGHLVRK